MEDKFKDTKGLDKAYMALEQDKRILLLGMTGKEISSEIKSIRKAMKSISTTESGIDITTVMERKFMLVEMFMKIVEEIVEVIL